MSTYIPLGGSPKSPEERKELLARYVETEENLSQLQLLLVQKRVTGFLLSEKGYTVEDIEINKSFKVDLPETTFTTKADIVLKIDKKRLCIIKCAMSSLESWERYSVAFCRVVESYQIPYAVVTDGEAAILLDAVKGEVISEGINSILSKEECRQIVDKMIFTPCPENKLLKEKRILYAFDAIGCPPTSS